MRPTVLYGEYDLTLDEKNRLSLPAQVRKSLDPERDGEAFYILIGINRKPWLYPERVYEEAVSQTASQLAPQEDLLLLDQLNFGMTDKVTWDKQGRMQLQQVVLRRANIGKEVTLVGVRNHLELWNRADWASHSEELLARRAEIAMRGRQHATRPLNETDGPR